MEFLRSHKRTILIFVFAGLLASTFAALAIDTWSKQFDWQIENESFTVYKDAAHTQVWDEGSETFGVLPIGTTVRTFYIVNDGNVAITVYVSGETITGAGNSASWDSTSLSLGVGASSSLTLTLTVASAGSYSFTFSL